MSVINGISKNYNPKRFDWQTAPVKPITGPQPPKSLGEKWKQSTYRFPSKPWFRVPAKDIVPPHRERRIARAIGRFAQAVAA